MQVNHNISALIARTQLKKSENNLSTSLERLSSGYKITKSADNPAGLAISGKMRAQIAALERASDNASDGDSVIQTAEGVLSEVTLMLHRMRELSVQAANDTNTLDDRTAIQSEIDELLDELDRVSKDTEYNQKYLLDGSLSHTGVASSAKIDLFEVSGSVPDGEYKLSVDSLGEKAELAFNVTPIAEGTDVYLINGMSFEVKGGQSTETIKKNLAEFCGKLNLDLDGAGGAFTLSSKVPGSSQIINIQYPDGTKDSAKGDDATVTLGEGFTEGKTSYIANGNYVTIADNNDFRMTFNIKKDYADGEFSINVYHSGFMSVQIGANEGQLLEMNFPEVSCTTLELRTPDGNDIVNVCSAHGATNAIELFDNAIKHVSEARSNLGAYQNRLDAAIASVDISVENMTDAMSRITDTDMADEMTKYTQYSVISQAATSILAQANNRAETIMNILQM